MKVALDEFNYINGYCEIGDIEGSVELKARQVFDLDKYFDYQYIDGKLKHNPVPEEKPKNFAKPKYNGKEWVECGTQEELIAFYGKELEAVHKISAEVACGILDEEIMEGIKDYIKSINPHSKIKSAKAPRPEIFDRYGA